MGDAGTGSVSIPLLLLIGVLLALAAFFSGTETALFSLSRVDRRKLEEDKTSRRAQLVARTLHRPRRVLSTILFGSTLLNVGVSAAATIFFERVFGENALLLTIVVTTFVLVLLADIIPKTIAVSANVVLSRATVIPLDAFTRLSAPFVTLFDHTARAILRLLRVPEEAKGAFTQAELELLFEEASKEETITLRETEIARNIMQFSDTTAEEVMTPRVELVAAPLDLSRPELEALMIAARHSRIPIYEGGVDSIVGFLSTKEFLLHPEGIVRDLLKPVAVFPEGARIHRVLRHMQKNRVTMAVIVNEYGETSGIVTMEDLVEEIVGEIHNEYEKAERLIQQLGPREWLVQGRASIGDVNEVIGLTLPDADAITLNGYLCDRFGEIPRAGRVLEEDGVLFTVVESGRRIVSCRVEKLTAEKVSSDDA